MGVNNLGDIVGDYWDGTGNDIGFIWHNGNFASLSYPGGSYTDPYAINDSGDVVGDYGIGSGFNAFLYQAGAFSTITVPGSGPGATDAFGINDTGDIVGDFYDPNGTNTTPGFLYEGGSFVDLNPPIPVGASSNATTGKAISNANVVVGYYQYWQGGVFANEAFIYHGGSYTTFSIPGTLRTLFYGVNKSGDIVGVYQDSTYGDHGFLYHAGGLVPLIGPDGGRVFAEAINDAGVIVGDYWVGGTPYGFVATPNGSFFKNLGGGTTNNVPGECSHEFSGNPINNATGNKFQRETDYLSVGESPLRLTRYYNSQASMSGVFGGFWSHNYTLRIQLNSSTIVYVVRPDGKVYNFTFSNGTWTSDADVDGRLTEQTDSSGHPTGWQYTNSRDQVESYSGTGQLLSITDRDGLTQAMTYSTSGTPTSVAPGAGYLITVTDAYGKTLSFTYDSLGRLSTMTDPAGNVYRYGYDTNSNLSSVTYPDGHTRTYQYTDTNLPHALTGIVDENGNQFASFGYDDATGNAISTTHAGSANQYNLSYTTDSNGSPASTAVTTPLGASETYDITDILGVEKIASYSWPCVNCGGSGSNTLNKLIYGYDANGNVSSVTDQPGDGSPAEDAAYTWDSTRNLLDTDTQANGTAQQVTTQTTWDPNYRLPDRIVQGISPSTPNGLKETDYTYDSYGHVTQKTEKDLVNTSLPSHIRTWTMAYTYDIGSSVPAAVLSKVVTDPMGNQTTYSYYAPDATCPGSAALGCRGQLESVGQVLNATTTYTTTVNTYDADGRPLTITDPNGLVTTLSYTPRGWVKSIQVGAETTSYQYDNAGNLILVTRPDGSHIGYGYDQAHRLTSISLEDNNQTVVATMTYQLDNAGDITKTQILDASGNVNYSHSDIFDSLGRLYQDIGAANQTATDTRDAHNNLTSYDGPRTDVSDITTYGYDALNRLIKVTAADGGVTQYGYDGLNHLTSVTDPLTQTTQYTKDAFGDVLTTVSPDTGTTTYTYDKDGNVLTRKDAQGNVTTYAYDALNRLISKSSSLTGTPTYTYSYDDCGTYSIGKLCWIDINGNFDNYFTYDSQERLQGRINNAKGTFNYSSYTYRPGGQVASITYSTNGVVNYQYDGAGRVDGVTYTPPNSTTPITLASNFTYHPLAGPESFTFGNGQTFWQSLNGDYRSGLLMNGPYEKLPSYDPSGDVTSLGDINNTIQNFTYDAVGRLLTATNTNSQSYGSLAYTYDLNGNRTSATQNGTTIPYTYSPAGSNRLYQAGG